MRTAFNRVAILTLLASMLMVQRSMAQAPESGVRPALASGTLNLILANKNGFVIAADSRMSSENVVPCDGKNQTFCDNSQKLFRTGRTAAMVIAGFAVGSSNSPLDLTVASLLRKRFGSDGIPDERGGPILASNWVQGALGQSLMGVAALYDPAVVSAQDLTLIATFAGFNEDGTTVVRQLRFTPTWRSLEPLNIPTPEYQITVEEQKITRFFRLTAGITCVADAILAGTYKSDDPIIRSYRQKLHNHLLDAMPLQEMRTLAEVILRETRNFTPMVGGEDQIGVFPINGEVQWHLPAVLPSHTQLSPNFILSKGLFCRNAEPSCTGGDRGLIYFQDFQHPLDQPIAKFFLASRFEEIDIALDNNYFVKSRFEDVTLKWSGGAFPFMRANTYERCTVEIPEEKSLPSDSELNGKCHLIKKAQVSVNPGVVGAPAKMKVSGCVSQDPHGGVAITAGEKCGNAVDLKGPLLKP
jgi:hypothetical protein